ncbi:hypothetical protein Ancab_003873 [Ancistrocladus abbreviatus]
MLVKSENDFPSVGSFDGSPVVLPDILEQARLKVEPFEAIHWILKMKMVLNLKDETAYSAVVYMDLFFSRNYNKEFLWLTGLVAAACLAMTLEEGRETRRLPLPVIRRLGFRDKPSLQLMMELVLQTLEPKTDIVTPFPYIPYFISELCMEDPSEKLISASDLIFKTLEAAVLAVTHPKLSVKQLESTIGVLSLWTPQEIGNVTGAIVMGECSKDERLSDTSIYIPELKESGKSKTSKSFGIDEHSGGRLRMAIMLWSLHDSGGLGGLRCCALGFGDHVIHDCGSCSLTMTMADWWCHGGAIRLVGLRGVIQRCYHFMIKRIPKPKLDASSPSDEKAGSSSGTS